MEFSKVKSFAHIVPNEMNQHHFIPDTFQQSNVRPSNNGSTCELHVEGTNVIKQHWDLTQCIDTSEEPVYHHDLKNLAELAIKGYDVACLNLTVHNGSTATSYNKRRSNLQFLMDTLTELLHNGQLIEFAFLAVADSQCFDMRKQIKRSNDRIITRGMDSILKQVKDTSEIWKTVQDGCRDPFILTIRITDTIKKTQGRLQYFDLLSPRFISPRRLMTIGTTQADVIESSFEYLCHFIKSMNSKEHQIFDADLHVLTKELAKYLVGSNKLIVLGFIHGSIVNEIQLNETVALLDFITSLKDIPTRMSRNKSIEEVEEYKKLKINYQQLQKEHESQRKKLNGVETMKAEAIAYVDTMMAETEELKAQNASLEKLATAAEASFKCFKLQQEATKEIHAFELKKFEPEQVVHYVESDIKDSCIQELNLKVIELELDLQQANTKVFALQDKLFDLEDSKKLESNELKKSSLTIRESNERLKELEAQVQNLQDEKDFAQTQLRVTRQKIKEYAIQLETVENERSDFEIELRTTKDKLKKMKRGQGNETQGDLNQQLVSAKAETQRWMEKYQKSDNEYNKALADLPLELNKVKQEYEEREAQLRQKIKELKQKINEIKQSANENVMAARKEFDRLLELHKSNFNEVEEEETITKGKRRRMIENDEEDATNVSSSATIKAKRTYKKRQVFEKENESQIPKKRPGRPKKRQPSEEQDANQKKPRAVSAAAAQREELATDEEGIIDTSNQLKQGMNDEVVEVDIEGIDDDMERPPTEESQTSPIHELRTRTISSPIVAISLSKSSKNKKTAITTEEEDTKAVVEEQQDDTMLQSPILGAETEEQQQEEDAALRSPILGATEGINSPPNKIVSRVAKKTAQQPHHQEQPLSQASITSTTSIKKKRKLRSTIQSKTAMEHVDDASVTRSPGTWLKNQDL